MPAVLASTWRRIYVHCVNKIFHATIFCVFAIEKPFTFLPDFQKSLSRFSATRRGEVGAPPVANIPPPVWLLGFALKNLTNLTGTSYETPKPLRHSTKRRFWRESTKTQDIVYNSNITARHNKIQYFSVLVKLKYYSKTHKMQYFSVLVRMRSPVQIWLAAPKNTGQFSKRKLPGIFVRFALFLLSNYRLQTKK